MTPSNPNVGSCKKSTSATHTAQSLQQAYDAIRCLEERVNKSKRLFEREFHLQSLLTEDLSKQLAAKTKPIHAQLERSSSLLNSIQDENALWSEATQMANLSQEAEDSHFTSLLREGERIVETVMHHKFDRSEVTSAIDELIHALENS